MAQDEVAFGPFTHSVARGLVKDGKAVKLGSRSLAILGVLLERPGDVVGNRDIMARVWPGLFVEEANIRVHIGTLRKALGKNDVGSDYIENVPAQGYRFVGTVRSAADDADDRPPPAPVPPQSSPQPLPRNIDRLIGREQAIGDIARKVVEKSFVTVTGVGGIGKTSLAVEVARLSAGGYRDGAFFVDLSTLSEPALLCANIAQALKLLGIGKASMDGFLAAIKGLNALVVLDNCEHLIDDVALLVEGILTTAPDVHLLVTSREILRAQGEWVYRLPPLAAPSEQDRAPTAEQAMRYSAVELFVERVSSNDELFRLTDADAPVVAALCRHLDGVPLALELAAARVPLLGIHGLAASLDRVFDVLRGGRRTALQRHQTLRATLEWSYRLLDERERVVLHRLSAIRGSFTRDLAVGVAAFGAVSDDDVVEGIAELAKKSLVSVEHREQTVQFRLLETTRQYAAERLRDSGETDTVCRNLALQLCRMLTDSQSTSTVAWNGVYGGRIDDLRSALEWSLSPSGDLSTAIALTIDSAPMWFQLSLTDEFRLRADKVLNAIRQQPNPDLRAEMAITAHLGPALWNSQGPTREVRDILSRGLALSRQLGDVGYQRRALWGLWLYHLALEEDQDALGAADRFGTLLGDPVDLGAESMHQRMMTLGLLTVGEFDRARSFAERCLSAPAPTRGSSLRGYQFEQRIVSLTHLARISWIQGQPDQARQAMEEAMEQALASGHALSLCFALSLGACPVAFWLGDYERAARYADMLVEKTSEGALFVWRTYGLCFQLALEARTTSDSEVASLRRSSRFAEVHRNRRIRMLATVAPRLIAPDILAEANASPRNWATAELLRLKAEATPDRDEADSLLRQSMDVARTQGATSWSLRTAMSMARRHIAARRPRDATAVLLPVCERFTDGHDTPDLLEAAALLDSIA